ncbi:MAG: hypothetical protein Q8N18_06015 [Opitutaceae bacterium]|nr:hypothetical protein [Opitutaceae bacterium]
MARLGAASGGSAARRSAWPARGYLERTNASVETVNRAAEIRTLAERQMGAFLKQMPKNEGGDPVPHRNRVDEPATLAEIGITKKQSATAQKLADIPEPQFRERIAVAKAGAGAAARARGVQDGDGGEADCRRSGGGACLSRTHERLRRDREPRCGDPHAGRAADGRLP